MIVERWTTRAAEMRRLDAHARVHALATELDAGARDGHDFVDRFRHPAGIRVPDVVLVREIEICESTYDPDEATAARLDAGAHLRERRVSVLVVAGATGFGERVHPPEVVQPITAFARPQRLGQGKARSTVDRAERDVARRVNVTPGRDVVFRSWFGGGGRGRHDEE